MKHQLLIKVAMSLILSAVFCSLIGAAEPPRVDITDVPRISKEDTKAKLGKPDVVVIDVRLSGQLVPGQPKILGAKIENPREVHNWIPKYPKEKTLILYCA
jgi:hypothetical protein